MAEWLEERGQRAVQNAQSRIPVETGVSQASIRFEVRPEDRTLQVGSDLLRVRYLEIGTERMAPRPSIVPGTMEAVRKR